MIQRISDVEKEALAKYGAEPCVRDIGYDIGAEDKSTTSRSAGDDMMSLIGAS